VAAEPFLAGIFRRRLRRDGPTARIFDEVAATQTMLDRTEERVDLKPKRFAADTAYGTGKFLGWLVKQKKIIPHIPVWDDNVIDLAETVAARC
jgi:hypothetical protein